MQEFHTPKQAEGASLSRRNFISIAAAGAAATLPAVALAEASGKTGRLPQPLDVQFDECVARLRSILQQMHPAVEDMRAGFLGLPDDGSFRFTIVGDVSFRPFAGDGIYLVSDDGVMIEYLVREERRLTPGGRDLEYSRYLGRTRALDGGWDHHEKSVKNFVRKIGEVLL